MKTEISIHKKHIQAMNWSLGIGISMLGIKWLAYFLSSSTAILSEAMESIVHTLAVGFAYYSLRLSHKPKDADHPYGHERVVFFSVGLEGLLIFLAAILIIFESIRKSIYGVELSHLNIGIYLIAVAALAQLILGKHLISLGEKTQARLIKANGKHLLTDFWTSFGVLWGLMLVYWTGWSWLDPILAIGIALHILWEGFKLLKESVDGLMDKTNPQMIETIKKLCFQAKSEQLVDVHNIRARSMGHAMWVDLHLIFPDAISLTLAHQEATKIEGYISSQLGRRIFVNTHLEPQKYHDKHHQQFRKDLS